MTKNIGQDAAFDLLDSTVQDYLASGRRTYSAALKPELKMRSGGGFDHEALGYETFRAFLIAAQEAGRVTLHRAQRGPDVEVTPAGQMPPPPAPGSPSPKRLRNDLWRAWIDWTPGYRRVYDREDDTTQRIPAVPTSALPEEQREVVEALEAGHGRAIEIHGLTIEEQLRLMAEFADRAGDEGAILREALTADKPAQEFRSSLRTNRRMHDAWMSTLVGSVRKRIEAWVEENGLQIDIEEQRTPQPATGSELERPEASRAGPEAKLAGTRHLVHQAVDSMTLSELLDLRIAVRHLVNGDN